MQKNQKIDFQSHGHRQVPTMYIFSLWIRRPAFAHMAVIRKKDERRKLKGTTCKECEIVSIVIIKPSNADMFFSLMLF